MKLGKILEKQAKNRTNGGFSIDKRGTKPHRKRRWVRFYPHKHWVFLTIDASFARASEGTG
jgi:hypothetical protein